MGLFLQLSSQGLKSYDSFLFSYPFPASWPKQWGTNQETSSGRCLWRGAKIRSKSAERNGGVWVVHQSAERRDELHQRCESLKDFFVLFLVYILSVACKKAELEYWCECNTHFGRIPSVSTLDGNVSTYLYGPVKSTDIVLQWGLLWASGCYLVALLRRTVTYFLCVWNGGS